MKHLPFFGPLTITNASPGDVGVDWTWRSAARPKWGGVVFWAVASGRALFSDLDGPDLTLSRGDLVMFRWDRARFGRRRWPATPWWCRGARSIGSCPMTRLAGRPWPPASKYAAPAIPIWRSAACVASLTNTS